MNYHGPKLAICINLTNLAFNWTANGAESDNRAMSLLCVCLGTFNIILNAFLQATHIGAKLYTLKASILFKHFVLNYRMATAKVCHTKIQ